MKNRVLIVTIDGWGTNLLGAYGISLCETPALDQLAAHAVTFDRYLSSSSDTLTVLKSMSDGLHPSLVSAEKLANHQELLTDSFHHWIEATNRKSLFITDCREVSETSWADRFTESLLLEFSRDDQDFNLEHTVNQEVDQDAWMETQLAQFVGEALSELSERQSDEDGLPDVVWIHLSGLSSIWDAPYEYRLALCDEEDPRPSYSQNPASFEVNETTDLDEVFQAMCAAAGQAKLIDHLWNWIDAFIDQLPDREQLAIVLAGTRGYPLGEHACVGLPVGTSNEIELATFNVPHSELVHVPLIIQPGYLSLGYRSGRVTQSKELRTFLEDWLGSSLDLTSGKCLSTLLDTETTNDQSCWIESFPHEAIYTQYWAALFDSNSGDITKLYLMPDDRWQQNDVLNRASEIADAMSELRTKWQAWKSYSTGKARGSVAEPIPFDCLRMSV